MEINVSCLCIRSSNCSSVGGVGIGEEIALKIDDILEDMKGEREW